MAVNLAVKWLALSALTALLAFAGDSQAGARNAAVDSGASAAIGADQEGRRA